MSTSDGAAAGERLRQALDLFEAGVSMKRASLRRQYPDADAAEIDRLVRVWLATRPGAVHGDAVGRPRSVDRLG